MGKRHRSKSNDGRNSKKVKSATKRKRPLRLDGDQQETAKFKLSEGVNDLIKPFDNALRSRLSDNTQGIRAFLIKSNDRPNLKVETILSEDSSAVSCLLLYGSNLAIENTIYIGESIKRQWLKTNPAFETITKIFRIPDEQGGHSSRLYMLLIKSDSVL